MINLNFKGDISPQMRSDFETQEGTPASQNGLSALAHRVGSRLVAFSNRRLLHTGLTRTVSLIFLMLCAFNIAKAQIYTNDFDGGLTTTTNVVSSPIVASGGGTIFNSALGCTIGSANNHYYNSDGSSTYSFSLTLTIASGFQLNLTGISAKMRTALGTSGAPATNNPGTSQITVNAVNYGSLVTGISNNCTSVAATGSGAGPYTGAVTISWSGSKPTFGAQAIIFDDIVVTGSISCLPPTVLPIAGTSLCPGGTGTVTIANSQSGVTYQLYKDNIATGSTLAGTGVATPIQFLGLGGGTYTVKGINGLCSSDMTGSWVVKKAPVVFTVGGGGNICSAPPGGTVPVTLNGSEVGVTYDVFQGATLLASMPGTGSNLTFNASLAGTYTIQAENSTTVCGPTLMSGSVAVTVSQPTAAFAATPNNGDFCSAGGNGVWTITGTPLAIVSYNVGGGPTQTVNIQPNGIATITVNGINSSTTVNLTAIQNTTGSTGCTQNLNVSNTLTVRQALSASIASSESVCDGNAYSSITVTASSGTSLGRFVYYSLNTGAGFVAQPRLSFGVGVTTQSINAGTASFGTNPIYRLDKIVYATPTFTGSGDSCAVNLNATVTKTALALPTFNFTMNNVTLVTPGNNTICMAPPNNAVVFNITNATPGFTYSVTKNGNPFGSTGTVNNNGVGLLQNIDPSPAGTYVVTVTSTSSPACPKSITYTVIELQRPPIAYYINGQLVSQGDTVKFCQNQLNIKDSLVSTAGSQYVIANASTFNAGPANIPGGGNATSTQSAPAVGVYNASITMSGVPLLPSGCDSVMSFYIQVTPLPTFTVLYNNASVAPNATMQTCEDVNPVITIVGTPGHTVEIHYNKGTSISPFTQLQTGVIGTGGTYVWNSANGTFGNDYSSDFDASCATPPTRMYYNIEVKNPDTWCSSTFDFNAKINQKPSIRMGYSYNNFNVSAVPSPGTIINPPTDTIRICYDGSSILKYYFDWDAARNIANVGPLTCPGSSTTNTLTFQLHKGSISGPLVQSGSLTSASVSGGNTVTMPITASVGGLYTLSVNNTAGCDSSRSFFVVVSPMPSYVITETGSSPVSNPGVQITAPFTGANASGSNPVKFCEGYIKSVTVSGAAGQTYWLTRVSGPGVAQNFGSSSSPLALVPGGTVNTFNGLDVGVHHYLLTVSSPGGCLSYQSFQVQITQMPRPTLSYRVNGASSSTTIAPGSTLGYCQEDVVEYRISGLPAGISYTLFRGAAQIATGISASVESSVITLVSQPNLAGAYTIKVNNTATSSCDSSYSFNVNITDRPDLTIVSTTNVLVCNGDNSGSVVYSYIAQGTSINTLMYRNGIQILNSTSGNTALQLTTNNLYAGNYLLVIASNGCSDSATFTISQPATPVVLTVTGTTAACGSVLGNISFTLVGGSAPYAVNVYLGSTNTLAQSTSLPTATVSPYTFAGLSSGTYTITVTDALGCVKTATFTIQNCSAPDIVPVASLANSNYSQSGTASPGLPFVLKLFNIGMVNSSGTVTVGVLLPTGFSISNTGLTAGWTVSTLGPVTVLTSTSAVIPTGATPLTINGNILLTGSTTNGVYGVTMQVGPGSGGETNSANNSTNIVLNVIP